MSEHKHLTFFSSLTNFNPSEHKVKTFPTSPSNFSSRCFTWNTLLNYFLRLHIITSISVITNIQPPPLTQPHPLFHVKQSFFSQAFWPIPQLTPAGISSTINISPQCFTWNTHPKRIPISSFCNQRPTTRSISPLNHVRETILFHVEHCWDQCYLQRYISRKTYKQARRLNAIFSLKSICYTIF